MDTPRGSRLGGGHSPVRGHIVGMSRARRPVSSPRLLCFQSRLRRCLKREALRLASQGGLLGGISQARSRPDCGDVRATCSNTPFLSIQNPMIIAMLQSRLSRALTRNWKCQGMICTYADLRVEQFNMSCFDDVSGETAFFENATSSQAP